MAITDEKHAEYLVKRCRELGASTTKWALLFLLAIVYTWLVSIYPRKAFIKNYITVVNKQIHFDTLSSKTASKKHSLLHIYSDSLEKSGPQVRSEIFLRNKTEGIKHYNNLSNIVSKAKRGQENRDSLKLLLVQVEALKGKQKKKLADSVRKSYLPLDILLAMTELQKSEAEKQRDSLINKMTITFNVPGLSVINFGFRIGLIFWMILNLILLSYVFSIRQIMIRYLKQIYSYHRQEFGLNVNEWKKLDLQVPLWMAPIVFRKGNEKNINREFIGWNFTLLNNMLGLGMLLMIVTLQLQVAWLCWHVSFIRSFENIWMELITAALLCITFLLFLLWLQPISLSPDFSQQGDFSFQRREYIKAGISAAFFLFIIPSIGRSLPLIKGKDLNYKRSRLRNTRYKVKLSNGFYVHKTKRGKVVYYFYNGVSPSMKSIDEASMRRIVNSLVKIDIQKSIIDPNFIGYSIPYWPFVLEAEAYNYAVKSDFVPAIKLILFALSYSMSEGDKYIRSRPPSFSLLLTKPELSQIQHKFRTFLIGLCLRAEKYLPEPQLKEIQSSIAHRMPELTADVFNPDHISVYRSNKFFAKKWQLRKNIPWHLPNKLPWS